MFCCFPTGKRSRSFCEQDLLQTGIDRPCCSFLVTKNLSPASLFLLHKSESLRKLICFKMWDATD